MEDEKMANILFSKFLKAVAQLVEVKTGDKEAADIVRNFKIEE